MTHLRVPVRAALLALIGVVILSFQAPLAHASSTAWTSYNQTGGTAKASYNYQWYSRNDNRGGFHIKGTLYDTVAGDVNNAKFRVRVNNLSWGTQYSVKNTSALIPDLVWFDFDLIITRYAYTETCEGKPLFDTCSTASWTNPLY
ncbi:MAG: hypothetical protein FWF75_02955 [Propionibacteriaceae bacterium]|nr:hypothetical protein [Propionibacteriaceae bacterium]